MTQRQLEKKVRQVARAIHEQIIIDALRLAKSGAVDVASATDDYILPKALLARACEKQGVGFTEHAQTSAYRKALRHF